MDTNRIITLVKPWIAPVAPGRGKKPALALCLGFLFGPVGVLLYLRSIADALLLLCLQAAMLVLLGTGYVVLCIVGGCYALSRVLFDSRRVPPPGHAGPASLQVAASGALV